MILKAVAWADIILCTIGHYLPYAIAAFVVGIIVGGGLYRCRFRR